jgi:hypothetical protein
MELFQMKKEQSNTKLFFALPHMHPAVIAVWSAVVAAGYLIPTFPILGTGANFTVANALNPLSGIFFGPIGGALCSLIGGFIGFIIAPVKPMLGPVTCIIAMTTAFTAGCIAWSIINPFGAKGNRNFIFLGGIIVYIAGTVLWFTQEIGRNIIQIPLFFYGLGFIIMTAGFIFAGKLFAGKNKILILLAIWICSFAGLIGGASIGNYFSLILFRQPKELWLVILYLAPVERAIFSAAAALVGVSLITGLNKINIFVGPQSNEEK